MSGSGQAELIPIEPAVTLQTRVYAELRRALSTGVFVPGQAISLRTLADRLGTSAMPVRDAVNRLIAEHALEMMPNRTVIVPRMTRAKFRELTRVRELLEGEAVKLACDKVEQPLLVRLRGLNERLVECAAECDVRGALAANRDFHFSLYEAADTQVILPTVEALWLQAGPFLYWALATPGTQWSIANHLDLLAALEHHDPAAAERAVVNDIHTTADYLLGTAVFDDP